MTLPAMQLNDETHREHRSASARSNLVRLVLSFALVTVLAAGCGASGTDAQASDDTSPAVVSVAIDGEATRTMGVGEAVTLQARVVTEDGADPSVDWVLDGDGVVALDAVDVATATLRGVAAGGPVTVTVTSVFDASKSASVDLLVEAPEPEPEPEPVTLSIEGAEVVSGSRIELTWSAEGANGFALYAVTRDGTLDAIEVTLDGSARSVTVPIPASDRLTLRLVAEGDDGEAVDEIVPGNVVVRSDDSDPYGAGGRSPDLAVPGTLRSVLANAAPGAIVGFAADVTAIDLFGVGLTDVPDGDGIYQDAHLVPARDVTISAPVGANGAPGVTLRADVGAFDGTAAFDGTVRDVTWRSRMLYVPAGVSVALENLAVEGGRFIYNGAGIRNDGTLRLDNVTLRDNRAWGIGGAIYNRGLLTMDAVRVDGNVAATLPEEVGVTYPIRGDVSLGEIIVPLVAGWGGGVYNEVGASLTVRDSSFDENAAKISAGSIYNAGTLTMQGSDVTNSFANRVDPFAAPEGYGYAGAIYTEGTLTFEDGAMRDNDALHIGGALFVDVEGDATIRRATIQANAADYGGGIRHEYWIDEGDGNLDVDVASVVTGNVARVGVDDDVSSEALERLGVGATARQEAARFGGRARPSFDAMYRR